MSYKDRIKELKRVPAGELLPNPKNWREHPEKQRSALSGVLAEVGWADAVIARETSAGLMLIDGHLRTEVAPDDTIPVLVLDVDEDEADKILATHDPLAAMAETNAAALDSLLRDVNTGSEGVQEMLAELANSAGLYPDDAKEIVEDEVPEPPKKAVVKEGEIWQLGSHRLMCGDCRDSKSVSSLMNSLKINVAITSPPYASQRKYDETSEFKPIPPNEYVSWFDGVQKNIAKHLAKDGSWFLNIKEHCQDGQRHLYVKDLTLAHCRQWEWLFVDEFIWSHSGTPKAVKQRFKNGWEPIFQFTKNRHKFRPDNVKHASSNVPEWNGLHPNAEDIQQYGTKQGMRRKGVDSQAIKQIGSNADNQGKGLPNGGIPNLRELFAYPSNVLSLGKNREALGHPAAYPTSLPKFFISAFSDTDDSVYDPFLGSGTTLIAAEQLGRECYGMEISPQYCDVIIERWQNLTGQKAKRVKDGT